jgi:hypothetical protein
MGQQAAEGYRRVADQRRAPGWAIHLIEIVAREVSITLKFQSGRPVQAYEAACRAAQKELRP